ncbi:MAG: hypothetical protein LBV53_01370 [Mycoplasmataceae bacterium]|nr:hypothetical protein [Mycoplasmataceae bacterium]
MERITKKQKEEINGGIGPMMVWTIITGVCLAISTIASLIPQQNNQQASGGTSSSGEQAMANSGGQKKFLRVSARVTSSAFFLPI